MRKYLLPETGNFYKANLHCHSTVSDGRWTPEQIKSAYKAEGYSVVAFTDHDVLIAHPELADDGFLPLNGYEIELNEKGDDKPYRRTCHICLIALEPDNLTQICWHREKYLFGNSPNYKDRVKFDENEPDFEREYTPECINEIFSRARENGFFSTYNHPTWSLEDFGNYINYHGMNAMEIVNHGCIVEGYDDYNPRVYDDMLRFGERIFCLAADDNHNWYPDSFGGFIMIKAENLEYRTITRALEKGDFYASQGPKINALWYEDGKIHIECEKAKKIDFSCGKRKAKCLRAKDGEYITSFEWELPEGFIYVRATVTDENGRHANTQAYFEDRITK